MTGFDQDAARFALKWGWSRQRIEEVHAFAVEHDLSISWARPWGFVFGGRFVAYRDRDMSALERAWIMRFNPEPLIVYTDGSGTVDGQPAGIGVLVVLPFGPEIEFNGNIEVGEYIGLGTNNVAELTAIQRALQEVPDLTRKITIRADSEYAIGCASKPWKFKKNKALVEAIREDVALRAGTLTWEHVDGHTGEWGNETVDKLAKKGRDIGFAIMKT